MTIRIGSNIASLTSQRRLGEADSSLSKTFERLSSGQRINRASDDAAGLAIADDLKAKGRIYTQAIRNGNDGISLLNIADSAIDALSGVVTRIRELSEQSANGTYSNEQRAALDAEAQALSKEFTRITQTTSFNGIIIFDGSLGSGIRLQLGVGMSESINASVGGSIGTGEFSNINQYANESFGSYASALGDLNGDGILDLVTVGRQSVFNGAATVRLGTGNGSFGAATLYTTDSALTYAVALGDLNRDGILDLVTAGSDDFGNGSATIRLGQGNGTFGSAINYTTEGVLSYGISLGDLNNDGILDMVTAGGNSLNDGYTGVRLGNGDGSFGSMTRFTTEGRYSAAINLGDLNNDGILDMITAGRDDALRGTVTVRIGLGNGSFGSAIQYTTEINGSFAVALGDLNNDSILDIVTAGQRDSGNGYASVRLGQGNGTFGNMSQFSTEGNSSNSVKLGDLNGDGNLDLITAGTDDINNGYLTIRLGTGSGSFAVATQYTTESRSSTSVNLGDINSDGVLDIITAGLSDSFAGFATVFEANTKEGLGSILSFSLKTTSDSKLAMTMLDKTLENLARQRGTIGASQSRVNIAISNLQSAKENFAAAESRIRDADVASEAGNLIRTQILQQAAASVLGQANSQPQLALQLLR